MRTRRVVVVTLAAIAAALTVAVGSAAERPLPDRPGIAFAPGVPDDLRALATSTWVRFLDAFPARWGCVPDVTVAGAWRFPNRGDYDPDTRLVTVRIPGTATNLRATMVHEFAHHLEFTCLEHRLFRPRFLAAQGLLPGTPWARAATWAEMPSEQWAEATIQVILGRRPGHALIDVRPAAVAAVRAWGAGR